MATSRQNVPALSDDDRLVWLALALSPGMGPRRVRAVIGALTALPELWQHSLTELEAMQIPAAAAQFLADGRARRRAEQERDSCANAGVTLLFPPDNDFPERLSEIYDPPPVLWVRGAVPLLSRPSLAVVGTRHPSPYGTAMAEQLSRDLALRRILILSGMARGIDTAAHRGALMAGQPTAAIWGTGIDVVYPKENKNLAEQIIASGGVIASELPLGTFPAAQQFPRRNRILSGLAIGVLVVEASQNSGTRVTARCAADQNRDLYAVPGNVTSKGSWTPNTLIQQGACLVATWEDVWMNLPSHIRLLLDDQPAAVAPTLFDDDSLPTNESLVLSRLRVDESLQLDQLLDQLDDQLTSAEVFTAIFELELKGRIRSLPGKFYVRLL